MNHVDDTKEDTEDANDPKDILWKLEKSKKILFPTAKQKQSR